MYILKKIINWGKFYICRAIFNVYPFANYQKWLEKQEQQLTGSIETTKKNPTNPDFTPLISILMPTYNSDPQYLCEAIDSIINQDYSNWELCIADDNSSNIETLNVLKTYEKRDARIKIVFRKSNGHISAATNTALAQATGQWITFLDHDDVLPGFALTEVVRVINQYPGLKLIYSDEDKIDIAGNRFEPAFKPGWNYHLLLGKNYLCHLAVYDAQLVTEVGGLRVGYEGAQDYDLVLRCVEKITAKQIFHIPKILYHWRILPQSTAASIETKPYALLAARKAVQEHLARLTISATVEPAPGVPLYQRVHYTSQSFSPLVSIVIFSYGDMEKLANCIASILRVTKNVRYEIIILANKGKNADRLTDFMKSYHDISYKVIPRLNGFADVNAASREANGEILTFLDEHIEVTHPDWLSVLIHTLQHPHVGTVGPKILYKNGKLTHAGYVLDSKQVAKPIYSGARDTDLGYIGQLCLAQNISALPLRGLTVRKNVFMEVNGFEEQALTPHFAAVDFCLKILSLGYSHVWTPFSEISLHQHSITHISHLLGNIKKYKKDKNYMRKKWAVQLIQDPIQNKHFAFIGSKVLLKLPKKGGKT